MLYTNTNCSFSTMLLKVFLHYELIEKREKVFKKMTAGGSSLYLSFRKGNPGMIYKLM